MPGHTTDVPDFLGMYSLCKQQEFKSPEKDNWDMFCSACEKIDLPRDINRKEFAKSLSSQAKHELKMASKLRQEVRISLNKAKRELVQISSEVDTNEDRILRAKKKRQLVLEALETETSKVHYLTKIRCFYIQIFLPH